MQCGYAVVVLFVCPNKPQVVDSLNTVYMRLLLQVYPCRLVKEPVSSKHSWSGGDSRAEPWVVGLWKVDTDGATEIRK